MRNRTKIISLAAAAMIAAASIGAAPALSQQGQGQDNQQMQNRMHGQMGPRAGMRGQMSGNMRGGMMGPMMGRMMQMMQGSRMMMGPMGPAMMMHQGRPSGDSLTADEARRIADGLLAWQGNDRLKLGEVTEQDDDTILIEILTVDDSLVQRIAMDRTSGMIRPVN